MVGCIISTQWSLKVAGGAIQWPLPAKIGLINKLIVNGQFILHLVRVEKLASLDIEWISFKLHLTFIDKMKLQESEILYKRLYFIIF